jgi:predicted O-methyltransferase YrrM
MAWNRRSSKTAALQRTQRRVESGFEREGAGIDYYGGVLVGAETIAERALDPTLLDAVIADVAAMEHDDYVHYVRAFTSAGRAVAGAAWRYADIVTVLAAATELLRPQSYLEIGVRRGRSMTVVARRAPEASIIGVDRWDEGYAGMDNPGPDLVRRELKRVGFRGSVEFLSGDSHVMLPQLFAKRRDLDFDLVTVDGDHSPDGAAADLRDVIPRIRIGGVLVFDDVGHETHPELTGVWRRVVVDDPSFRTWMFDDIGYGVALAVRRW